MPTEIIDERSWDEVMEEMCAAVDLMAQAVLTPDTPLYRFQQNMIHITKTYREATKRQPQNG
jgi:hypothetical protein